MKRSDVPTSILSAIPLCTLGIIAACGKPSNAARAPMVTADGSACVVPDFGINELPVYVYLSPGNRVTAVSPDVILNVSVASLAPLPNDAAFRAMASSVKLERSDAQGRMNIDVTTMIAPVDPRRADQRAISITPGAPLSSGWHTLSVNYDANIVSIAPGARCNTGTRQSHFYVGSNPSVAGATVCAGHARSSLELFFSEPLQSVAGMSLLTSISVMPSTTCDYDMGTPLELFQSLSFVCALLSPTSAFQIVVPPSLHSPTGLALRGVPDSGVVTFDLADLSESDGAGCRYLQFSTGD